MYRSWKNFIISTNADLNDVKRIKRLYRQNSLGMHIAALAFAISGLVCLCVSFLFIYIVFKGAVPLLSGLITILALSGMTYVFYFSTKLIIQEFQIDLLRRYLKTPHDFEITRGVIERANYSPGSKNRSERMLVFGTGQASSGKSVTFIEEFSPKIWPFAEKETKSMLPFPVYILTTKSPPHMAAMVGVDKIPIQEALKRAKML